MVASEPRLRRRGFFLHSSEGGEPDTGEHENPEGFIVRARFPDQPVPRIFAEYIEGGSLQDWIDDRRLYAGGRADVIQRILNIAIQFAWGLQYAHEQELIHHDVKPANVMMTPEGEAKVTDFGLASARASGGERFDAGSCTSIVASYGGLTPAFCSPEQAFAAIRRDDAPLPQGPKISRRTDVWSWAVSVLAMLVGGIRWRGGHVANNVLEKLASRGTGNSKVPRIPRPVVDLLEHCLQFNPDDRPHDMDAVATELCSIYCQVTGSDYLRAKPNPVDALADSLNNQAVSQLDLGHPKEAERLFDEALKLNPGHPQATYNHGLLLWRSARLSDENLVLQLKDIKQARSEDWIPRYLLGLVHAERGDVASAVEELEQALSIMTAGGYADWTTSVTAVLTRLRQRKPGAGSCLRTLEGHVDSVDSVAFSPDGRYGFSSSGSWASGKDRPDTTLRLWDLVTGECLRTFEGHSGTFDPVAISPDGRHALSGGDDALRLWDMATGQCMRTFERHSGTVYSVTISPDGRHALSGGDDALRLWDMATGQCLRTSDGRKRDITSVAFSPDGRYAFSGGGSWVSHKLDSTLRLWDLATGECLRIFEGHTDKVSSVAFSPDGRHGISGSQDHTLRLWDLATGQCLRTFEGHTGYVNSVAISPDGRYGLSGSWDNTVRLWDLATGRCVRTYEGHMHWVRSVAMSADGRHGLSGSQDHTLRLWDLSREDVSVGYALARPQAAAEAAAYRSGFHFLVAEAERLHKNGCAAEAQTAIRSARGLPGYRHQPEVVELLGRVGRTGRASRLLSGQCLRTFEGHTRAVRSVAISPDGRYGLSGSEDETLRLWDMATGRCLRTFEGHAGEVRSVVISPDGRYGLSGSADKTLRLWDLATGRCLRTFEGHARCFINAVAVSPDGRHGLSGGEQTLQLWDLATGQCLLTFDGHTSSITSLAISPDGRHGLSAGDEVLRLWDLVTGLCLRTFEGHSSLVLSVAISPDGRYGLSGSYDKTLRLWDLATGECLRTLCGHKDHVVCVTISPCGCYGLSGGWETIRLWDLATGECLRVFQRHLSSVLSVAISPCGRYGLSGSPDKTLRLWELDWEYEFPEAKDWDEGARPYLESFLTLHPPSATRPSGVASLLTLGRGRPTWTEDDFARLIHTLGCTGYGWLRPEGVRRELEKMACGWDGPPPLFADDRGEKGG